jgi:hypothetical protein
VKNVTLAIEAATLREARLIAAERSTTLNALIRDYLDELVRTHSRRELARRRILEICESSEARLGPDWKWDRIKTHER